MEIEPEPFDFTTKFSFETNTAVLGGYRKFQSDQAKKESE